MDDMNSGSARLMARVATAIIRAAGMVAENQVRAHRGEHPAYDEAAFVLLLNDVYIGENDAISLLNSYK